MEILQVLLKMCLYLTVASYLLLKLLAFGLFCRALLLRWRKRDGAASTEKNIGARTRFSDAKVVQGWANAWLPRNIERNRPNSKVIG